MPRVRHQRPSHPEVLPTAVASAARIGPSNVTRTLRMVGQGRVADLLAVQSAAGNAATAALIGRARTLQRVRLQDAEPFFGERYPPSTDPDATYLNNRHQGEKRRARIAEPAESVEHLEAILSRVAAKQLDEFVRKVQAASKPSVGSIGAVLATMSKDLPPEDLAALRLRHIYRVAAEEELKLPGMEALYREIVGLSGEDLQQRDDADRQARQEAREERRRRAERMASATRAVDEAVKLGIPKPDAEALCGTVRGGQELLENAFDILRNPLCIGPAGVFDVLRNTARSAPDEWEGRVRGGLYEFATARERLRLGHIIQMGNLAASVALTRIKALDEVRKDTTHPSHGAVRYADNASSIISQSGQVGADIIDWTTLVVLQIKTTQGTNTTIIKHIVKAIEQVVGRRREWPMEGIRTRLQALVRIDNETADVATLLSAAEVIKVLGRLGDETRDRLSLAISRDDTLRYFVPKKDGTGWVSRAFDPAQEKG